MLDTTVADSRRDAARAFEHRAEKWEPVFRKNDAATRRWSRLRNSGITRPAPEMPIGEPDVL